MKPVKALEALLDKIKKDYADDIAIVVVMGSTIYGETHARSDLDLYFVVDNDRGYELGKVFIIDGIGYDFWPISWERLTSIANHDERITSIITEGKIMYYKDQTALDRFMSLKETALDTHDHEKFEYKAFSKLAEAYRPLYQLIQTEDLSEARRFGIEVVYAVTNAIALFNSDTVKRGRGKLKKEILSMALVPPEFNRLYDTVFVSNEIEMIKSDIVQLFEATKRYFESKKTTHPFKNCFRDFYEELINSYSKIDRAVEINDAQTCLFVAVEMDLELAKTLARAGLDLSVLPNLVSAYRSDDLATFGEAAKAHQIALETLLKENGVALNILKDEMALRQFLGL